MNKRQISITKKQNTLFIIASSEIYNKVYLTEATWEFKNAQSAEKLMNYHDYQHCWTLF